MSRSTPVKVKVLGKSYQVSCPAGEETRVHQAAALLEKKILELRGRGVSFSSETMALITGLNLAHELISTQDELKSLGQTDAALGQLCLRVDQLISEAQTPLKRDEQNEAEPAPLAAETV